MPRIGHLNDYWRVSTHSRPKAAGNASYKEVIYTHSFNTQPPEGGWPILLKKLFMAVRFQHTAARRRLDAATNSTHRAGCFNTQPPEGGWNFAAQTVMAESSFNTQPPEGGWLGFQSLNCMMFAVSTHSRPKAAGQPEWRCSRFKLVSTHSRPKAAGGKYSALHQ